MSLEAPALKTHSLNEVIVVITRRSNDQSFELSGVNGDGIAITRTAPKYADIDISDDGKIAVRSANNDRSAKIMITGTQYSPMHQQLATLDIADPRDDLIDITISDLSNNLLYLAQSAYLSKFADVSYATAKGDRTHEITAPFIEMDKDRV